MMELVRPSHVHDTSPVSGFTDAPNDASAADFDGNAPQILVPLDFCNYEDRSGDFTTSTRPNRVDGDGGARRDVPYLNAAAEHVLFPPRLGNRGTVVVQNTMDAKEYSAFYAISRSFRYV